MTHRNNHTLSECLLKRFADDKSRVARYSYPSEFKREVPYQGQGYRKGLWQRTTKEFMEALWGDQAENGINAIFRKVDARTPLDVADKDLLVRFLAIHYVRSEEFIKVYERILADKARTANFDARLDFSVRYQLRLQLLRESGIPSQFFEDAMRQYYEMCTNYLGNFGLEIGVAIGNETFILPDGGLLLTDATIERSQPSGGVALTEATYAVMPLGPRHLAAFTSKSQDVTYLDLLPTEVQHANVNLKRAAINEYFRMSA